MKRIIEKYREIILYLFFGVLTTCVSWGSYALFAHFVGTGVAVANALSWFFATVFAFVTNKIFVFLSSSWDVKVVAKEFAAFVSARLGTGLFEVVAVPLVYNLGFDYSVLGVEGAAAKITISFLVVVANYFLSKKIVFKKTEDQGKEESLS